MKKILLIFSVLIMLSFEGVNQPFEVWRFCGYSNGNVELFVHPEIPDEATMQFFLAVYLQSVELGIEDEILKAYIELNDRFTMDSLNQKYVIKKL